jgi:flagellar hook-associated protein FlgK
MSDMLGIASNGISAYQRALSTVSNNISNVNTEGYSRQDVVLKDSAPKKMASMYVGTGVMLTNIKRQFDAFAESNLRNSTSDLASQKPMVDYAKRVMDIMGDKSIGLSSAFDQFFASASALSADPASTVQRTSFLRSAEGVASRFGELNSQLDLIATETSEGIKSVAAQVNTLTSQLALINQSLAKSPTLEGQPAELLDRRDLTLRQLSDLVRTKVSFTTNGTVNVSLGTTMTQGLVVNGNKARPIGVDTSVAGKIELVLDPYGSTESLASASGGQLGGYQSFISQVLEPAQKNLSALAQTFVAEANTIQKNGIDGYGQMGAELFAFDPKVASPAAGMRLATNDGMRVATAAQFRVSEGNTNITTTRATVKFTGTTPTTQLSNTTLVNNPNRAAGVAFKVDGARTYTPVTTLSAGVGATFYLDEAEPGQQLQVMTRDGRQLLGAALSETEKFQIFTPENGFAANANYSDTYLNKGGEYAYRDLDMFYGAKATVLYGQNFDQFGQAGNPLPLPAALESARISSADFSIPAGAIQVNGFALADFNGQTENEMTFAGIDLGDVPSAKFEFQALLSGKVVRAEVEASDSMPQFLENLKTALASTGLTARLTNNYKDIVVTDPRGQAISGISLTPSAEAIGASVGHVAVSSAASQVAAWMNGKSQATIASPSFGLEGFQAMTANIGGVSFDVDLSDFRMGPLSKLAETLQDALRAKDNSTDISVKLEGDQLKITDALGREFKDFALVPTDAEDAIVGSVSIENSVLSKSRVRAEVFSEVRVPVAQLQLGKPLKLNDQIITGFETLDQLVDAINQSPAGLLASIGQDGQLIIENPQGTAIRIGSTPEGNALNVQPGTYDAQVRMVQVVRDMRVGSADLDFKKPLTINGVNFSESTYQLPELASSGTYSVEFGYPAKSVSATDSATLVSALNSSATISGVQWPNVGQTLRMDVLVDGKEISLDWNPASFTADPTKTDDENAQAKLVAFAASVSSQLTSQGVVGVDVSPQTGGLVFSNTTGISLTPLSLKAVVTGSNPEVSTAAGTIEPKFSATYYATVNEKNGHVVISSVKGDMPEADLKSTFVLKADVEEAGLVQKQDVLPDAAIKTLPELVARINAKQDQTGVVASIDQNGDLKLSTTDAKGTRDISIGPRIGADGQYAANALGLAPADYGLAYRLQQFLQDDSTAHDVRVSFGSYVENTPGFPPVTKFGDPADLANLGLRTGAYIEGGCPDDLLLFVTGKGSANVAVGFEGEPDNVRDSLRTQSLTVKFTAADRYNIIDVKTGTVLADRQYDPSVLEPVVEFNGLQIKLSHAPAVGDSYKIDGNFDGLGNNVNMLDMVDLNKKPTANGKTLANTYIDQINSVGNLAQQAIITQEALTVVNEQAIEARDKVSGVNLDDEAAALIRYQQAYQACAKALQVSGELFDAIVQIR